LRVQEQAKTGILICVIAIWLSYQFQAVGVRINTDGYQNAIVIVQTQPSLRLVQSLSTSSVIDTQNQRSSRITRWIIGDFCNVSVVNDPSRSHIEFSCVGREHNACRGRAWLTINDGLAKSLLFVGYEVVPMLAVESVEKNSGTASTFWAGEWPTLSRDTLT